MPPTLSWSDLSGHRVGIYGLGREGQASTRACLALGIEPVLVDDVLDVEGVLPTTAGGLEALSQCEIVIAGPGVSRYGGPVLALRSCGVEVVGGLGLWMASADPDRVIAVTGTKGKSTATAVTGHLLAGLGVKARVGGNIGVPPYDPALEGPEPDLWVIEVSSYQAVDIPASPSVVGVTSLSPDHLPWHNGSAEIYYRDKLSICQRPGAQVTVANGASELLRAHRLLLGPKVDWVTPDEDASWATGLGLLGEHNRLNALLARHLLLAAGVAGAEDGAALARASAGFAGLESRLQLVHSLDGVSFVDDGLSTNVLPTLAAVDAFADRRVALVVGGQDRGIGYGALGLGLRSRTEDLLLITVPDNGERIAREVQDAGPGPRVTVSAASSLEDAVVAGFAWARPGGVVLLSPAAPSFGRFVDYRHRGQAFLAAARALTL